MNSKMNKIGFKNFRRFTDFPDLEYGPITFLVGRNNAGKSTLVKALLLINNYLRSRNIDKLDFGNNILEDINIVTYGRAKSKNAKDNLIQFKYQIDVYEVFIEVTGNEEDTQANVITLTIKDLSEGFYYELKPQSASITIGKRNVEKTDSGNTAIKTIDEEIKQLRNIIAHSTAKKTSKEYLELIDRMNQLNDRQLILKKQKGETDENIVNGPEGEYSSTYHAESNFDPTKGLTEIIEPIIGDVTSMYKLGLDDNADEEEKKIYSEYRGFYEDKFKIESSFKKFADLVSNNLFVYLGANSFKQKSLFSIKDTLNPLAQAINEYKQLGIELKTSSPAYTFTRKWMQDFEIGDDLEIIMHAGEAYEVLVKSHNTKIPLADKGMGSVQAMLLILRLACIIEKYGDRDVTVRVVIEEPELNLHPALQSKLADLILFVNDMKLKKQTKCSIEFIIETHSEYIIRRSQVIVAKEELQSTLSDNPFFIYYFPKDILNPPYRIDYNEDGSLKRNFEEGFFDAGSFQTLELLKIKKQKSK